MRNESVRTPFIHFVTIGSLDQVDGLGMDAVDIPVSAAGGNIAERFSGFWMAGSKIEAPKNALKCNPYRSWTCGQSQYNHTQKMANGISRG